MYDEFYLIVTRYKVERMTKNPPGALRRGETVVKVSITMAETAFRPPTLERAIVIADWREGMEFADVDLRELTISEEEAELIRERRRAALIESLTSRGYTVIAPEPEGEDQ